MRARVLLAGTVLIVGAACVSVGDPPEASGTRTPSPASSPTSSALLGPTGLKVDQPTPWQADPRTWGVTFSWSAPPGLEVDHYEVLRDGRPIAKDVAATRYSDEHAEPAATYRYSVLGVDAGGTHTATATVGVDTGSPPLADARLEGRFGMKMHITSQSGLSGGAGGGGDVFLYDPHCAKGPCDVTWSRRGSSGSGSLARDGASYSGTVSASFVIGSCHGRTVTESLVFATRITRGAVVRSEWRATKIEGTLDETATSSGCVTAHIGWTYAGFAQA